MKLKKSYLMCGVVLIFIAVLFIFVKINNTKKDNTYSKAINLLEDGSYEEAQELFKTLNNYKDSKKQIDVCKEQQINFSQASEAIMNRILPIAEGYGIDDIKVEKINEPTGYADYYLSSDEYESLSDEDKYYLISQIFDDLYEDTSVFSEVDSYSCKLCQPHIQTSKKCYRRMDDTLYEELGGNSVVSIYTGRSYSHSKTTNSSGKKCSVCNGTGTVKYYYGESALDAALDGHDDYEWGPCSSCNGTGIYTGK